MPNQTCEFIATNIKRLRLFHGKSVEKLAKETGIKKKRLKDIMDAKIVEPKVSELDKIAKALDVRLMTLFQEPIVPDDIQVHWYNANCKEY